NEAQAKTLTAETIVVDRNGEEKRIELPVNFVSGVIKSKGQSLIVPRFPFIVGGFTESSPNKEVLNEKDFIISVNQVPVKYSDEMENILLSLATQEGPAVIKRNDQEMETTLKVDKDGIIGLGPAMIFIDDAQTLGLFAFTSEKHSLLESIPVGL